MPVRKGYVIKELAYYFEREEIVFKTKDTARKYFNENNIFEDYHDVYEWREYLANRFYYDEVFDLTEEEKKEIHEDYKDFIFDQWVENELVRCEIYDDEEKDEE